MGWLFSCTSRSGFGVLLLFSVILLSSPCSPPALGFSIFQHPSCSGLPPSLFSCSCCPQPHPPPFEMAVADRSAWQRCVPPHAVHPQQPPAFAHPVSPSPLVQGPTPAPTRSVSAHPAPHPGIAFSHSQIPRATGVLGTITRAPTSASTGGTQRWVTQTGGSHGSLIG